MAINTSSRDNSILSRCDPRFGDSADEVTFRAGDVILRANQTTSHAYFPETVVATFVRRLVDGNTIEAGIVGFEGVIGVEAMFSATAQPSDVIVQVTGTAVRVPVSAACLVFEADREFRGLVLRFANAFTLQISQTVACNWFHSLEHRLARWLLKVADRVRPADQAMPIEISLTQEFLASMLGTRIASVNEAISTLTASGLIRHRRHLIEIIDRSALEGAACECYATVRALYARDKVM
ncbi:MAG TPA: Crp/Fnr family transcriptional regulator [Thermoanaerobaculia bacterium]|jgi:CRP-like cAMP-binding protein|nr:Crp/Fnr family transcriptional regulator [Thermoanaerobaculia bacterium]